MHYRIDLMIREDFFDLCADAKIGLAKDRFGRDGSGVALLKIIEGDDWVAAG
jgi:hypothetical protein